MSTGELLTASAVLSAILATLAWLVSLRVRNAGVADVSWSVGIVLVAALYYALTDGFMARKLLVLTLASVWGFRLATHLFLRIRSQAEDFRYRELREAQGNAFWWRSYFGTFLLQGAGVWLVSMPLLAAQSSERPTT